MHIVMVGPRRLYPHPKAGLDFYVRELSEFLGREGHEVTVYCHENGLSSESLRPRKIKIKKTWVPKIHHLDTFIHGLIASIRALKERADLIHYHGGAVLFSFIPRLLGKKVVVTIHSEEWRYGHTSFWLRSFYRFSEWVGLKMVHRIAAVSRTLKGDLEKRCRRDVTLQLIGMEPQSHPQIRRLKGLGLQPKKYLLFLGRLERGKGLEGLIDAYRFVEKKFDPAFPLVIAGEPLYNHRYFELLKRQAGPHLLFVGNVSGDLKKELLAHTLLYIQASEAEGLSLSLLEAMSFGVPILVSDIPQNREALGEAGFYFRHDRREDLKRQMEHLLENPNGLEAMGEKGRERILKVFSWESLAPAVEQFYSL